MTHHTSNSAATSQLRTRIARLRRRARRVLVCESILTGVAGLIVLFLIAAFVDFVIRPPMWVRLLGWAATLALTGHLLRTVVLPRLRFAPTLTDLVARLASHAKPNAELTAAVAILESKTQEAPSDTIDAIAQRALKGLAQATSLRRDRLLTRLSAAGIATVGVVALALTSPAWTNTAAQRLLTPWSHAAWPKRTQVQSNMQTEAFPIGSTLSINAIVMRSHRSPERTTVDAVVRIQSSKGTSPERRIRLAPRAAQSTDTQWTVEQRIDPITPDLRSYLESDPNVPSKLLLRFETEDDRTATQTIALVQPARVLSAQAIIEPPAYLAAQSNRTITLGDGTAGSGAAGAVVDGSRVRVALELNKTLAVSDDINENVTRLLGINPATAASIPEVTIEGTQLTATWTHAEAFAFSPTLTDAYGISTDQPTDFGFGFVADERPVVAIVDPHRDISVTPDANVSLTAEARDDIALASASLVGTLKRSASNNPSTDAEDETVELASVSLVDAPNADTVSARPTHAMRPTDFNLIPGDTFIVTATATDLLAFSSNDASLIVSSTPRVISIISEGQLLDETWNTLTAIRQRAMTADQAQARIAQRTGKPYTAANASADQERLTDEIAAMQETVQSLSDRLDRNNVENQDLRDMLNQASASAQQAATASAQSSSQLSRSADAERTADAAETDAEAQAAQEAKAEADAQAQSNQEHTREALSDVAELLDQGQDAWAVRRSLEQTIEAQEQLQEQTRQVGESTRGLDASELSPAQQQAIQEIAQEQRELANQLDEALERMLERADALKETDPETAEALAEAAAEIQRQQASEAMEQAAQDAENNQASNAQQQQQQALDAMQQAMQSMDAAQSKQDETLRRQIAELIERLDRLIALQRSALRTLENTPHPFAGLDAAMIRLHQDTLDTIDVANGSASELSDIASLIVQASDQQANAIGQLRAVNPEAVLITTAENASLDALLEAKALANAVDEEAEQRQEDAEKDRLKEAYAEARAALAELANATAELATEPDNRRTKSRIRRLSQPHTDQRDALDALRLSSPDLTEAPIFELAHSQIDRALGSVVDRLATADASAYTRRQQTKTIAMLDAIIESLDETPPEDDDEFREQEQDGAESSGEQGGQQDQPLIPPIAELKLLRSLQAQAASLTAEAIDAADAGDATLANDLALDAADLQSLITDHAKALLQKLSEQAGPDITPTPTAPASDNPPTQPSEESEPDSVDTPQQNPLPPSNESTEQEDSK